MVLMAERQRRPKRTETTKFGRAWDSLARLRGVRTQQQMADKLHVVGYPTSQPMISYYMLGDPLPPARLVIKIIEALDLDLEEQRQLARAWRVSLPVEEREALAIVWALSEDEQAQADLRAYEDLRQERATRETEEDGEPPGDR